MEMSLFNAVTKVMHHCHCMRRSVRRPLDHEITGHTLDLQDWRQIVFRPVTNFSVVLGRGEAEARNSDSKTFDVEISQNLIAGKLSE